MNQLVTEAEVRQAQEQWAQGIVEIGKTYLENGDYTARAERQVDELYAYGISNVLFKPTKAAQDQFRDTKEKAMSYFVATNGVCSEDKGFALQPWTRVVFENNGGMILGENYAIAMGNYFFTDDKGQEVKVEYTFGYLRDSVGNLRINLHHSSLPFAG